MLVFRDYDLGWAGFGALALGGSIVAGLAAQLLRGPAARAGLRSTSRRDRFGLGQVPLTGGPGLLAGMAGVLLALRPALPGGLLVGALGLFAVGLLDDARALRPALKLLLQAAVALAGAWFLGVPGGLLAFAVLWILLLVNASNYLDNMDGLLAGVALTQALALVAAGLAVRSAAGAGAPLLCFTLPAILVLTLPPARVYLGDSGSHLAGALLALDSLQLLLEEGRVRTAAFTPLLLVFAVPLLDTAVVSVSRLRRGRPLFRGGLDHLSHALVRRGWTVPGAVGLLVLASAVCCFAALLMLHAS